MQRLQGNKENEIASGGIIDGHVHLGPREIGEEYAYMGDIYRGEELVKSMNANGINMSVVWPMRQSDDYSRANRYVIDSAKSQKGRLIPFVRLNPWIEDSARRLNEAIAIDGAKGLKLHPGDEAFDPDDIIVHPLLEVAERAHIPVAIHTGGANSLPALIGNLADRFPGVRIIMLHLGMYQDSVFVAKKCDNVFLETSQSLYLTRIARQVVQKVGADRVIWGSDAPYHHQEIEKRKIELAGLEEEDRCLVMGGNLRRLLLT